VVGFISDNDGERFSSGHPSACAGVFDGRGEIDSAAASEEALSPGAAAGGGGGGGGGRGGGGRGGAGLPALQQR